MESRGTARISLRQAWGFISSPDKSRLTPDLRMSQSGLKTQTAKQPKFFPPTFSPGPTRHSFLARSVKKLSLTPKTLALAYYPLVLGCLLQRPAMRSNKGMANRQGYVDLRFAQVFARQLAH